MESIKNTFKKYKELSKNDTFDFEKFNEYAIVHHSNSIEGSTLTLQETILLLDEHLTPSNKPVQDTLMALDHLTALKYTTKLAADKKPLTIKELQHISSLLMKNTGSKVSAIAGEFDSSKGEFRKVTVRAGERTFMDYKKVPEHTLKLLNYINSQIDKTKSFEKVNELAFDAHYQLVSIHPFSDGNGRISRLLMNYIQAYHKYPLTIVYKENKQSYYNSLEDTRKKEDISIFRTFMFSQAKKFMNQRIKDLIKKPVQKKGPGLNFLF